MSKCYEYQIKLKSNFRELLQERIEKANPRRKLTTEEASAVWQTSDTKEQVNERTEERVWLKHVFRLTMCNKGLRKLLNCNNNTSVEKTCRVGSELHMHYEVALSV